MNISENKRVAIVAAIFGLAFCGIMYQGYTTYSAAEEDNKQLENIRAEFENYNASEFPPTTASLNTLRKAQEKAVSLNKEFSATIDRYASATRAQTQGINTPVDLQNTLNASITAMKKEAELKKVTWANAAADLGMKEFKNSAASPKTVPYRAFRLASVKNLAGTIIDAGAVAVDKIYCAPLPEDADTSVRRAPAYIPLGIEVSFTAKRSTLPQVLNALVKDKTFFYLITGVGVESDINLPSISPYKDPVVSDGDLPIEDPEAPVGDVPLEDESSIARPMTGLDKETVRVHLNLEVLYFNKK